MGYERPEVMEKLLDYYKVDPTIADKFSENALHCCARNKKSTRCTELLLMKMPLESIDSRIRGTEEGYRDDWGRTPLELTYNPRNDSPIKWDLRQLIHQHGGLRGREYPDNPCDEICYWCRKTDYWCRC